MSLDTDIAIGAKPVSPLREVLSALTQSQGAELTDEIAPILEINLERGRIANWLQSPEADIQGYVNSLVSNYVALSVRVQKLQIARDETLWKDLFEHLIKWAYGYLIRKNFQPGPATLEVALGQATEASLQILNSHFPYDVSFDLWCHRVLINTCAKFLRDQGRKANGLAIIDQSVEELAERLHGSDNPELIADQETLYERLTSAMKDLAPARAYIVHGYYFLEKDFATLAKELGKSVAAVHSLHFHSLNDLRRYLGNEASPKTRGGQAK